VNYRLATQHDVPLVMRHLLDMLDKSPSAQMQYASPMAAELGVRDFIHRESAVVWGDFFIMLDEFTPWFSNERFLCEVIILRISRETDAKVGDAIEVLEYIAQERGCKAAIGGDTQIGYMTPHYRKRGWEALGTQLIKRISNGVHP
jgi:hypothetical protein